jgi:hypothetical protein
VRLFLFLFSFRISRMSFWRETPQQQLLLKLVRPIVSGGNVIVPMTFARASTVSSIVILNNF